MSRDAIVLLSGGIDSTTVLADVRSRGIAVVTFTFDYGQSLQLELEVSRRNSRRYGAAAHQEVLMPLRGLAPGCSLLGTETPIDKGRTPREIADGGTPTSYVPFRNGLFFAYLVAWGEAAGIEDIYAGCNGLNSGNYPDDTKEFAAAMTTAAQWGTGPDYCPVIHVPFAEMTKANIVRRGIELGVDYTETYSCYRNTIAHCGACDSCVQRAAALEANGLTIEGKKAAR